MRAATVGVCGCLRVLAQQGGGAAQMAVAILSVAVRAYVVHSLLVSDSLLCGDVFRMNMASCCIHFFVLQVRPRARVHTLAVRGRVWTPARADLCDHLPGAQRVRCRG